MKIYLTDQAKSFPKHLEFLKRQDVIVYDISKLSEKTSSINIDTDKNLTDLDVGFFFNYNIFPGNIMTFLTQWKFEKRKMKIGDTIVQQAFIPPSRYFSQKIIFGVRINKIINESTKLGFSYETLEGHVEMGISTFTIEKPDSGGMIFKIHTFSKPGNLLTQLVAPIFSVPYQTFCTAQGLKNVKRQLERIS
jgi:uncharacterized protein DUF1990